MNRSAWRRMRRNCHHLRKMRYQETIEKTTRIASTNFVSRLDVSTSSQGVVGTARPACSSSTLSALLAVAVPVGMRLVPGPGGCQNLFQARVARPPAEHPLGASPGRDEERRVSR